MSQPHYLSKYSKSIEEYSDKAFSDQIKLYSGDKIVQDSLKNLQKYMAGGKKIRPALTILGYQIAGGKNIKSILPAAFAVELVHSSLIIHDDFIDHDVVRRGKKTIHEIYRQKHGEHYGASMAIFLGDIGIFWANGILSGSDFKQEFVNLASKFFNFHLLNTAYGEMMDIDFDFQKKIKWQDILNIRVYKTAYYTFVMPLLVGFSLGGGSKKIFKYIEEYGKNVGLAFQLQDDILGVFGNEKETGKSNISDIAEGKKTLLYLKTLELASGEDRMFLQKHYGKTKDGQKIEKIKNIIKEKGALSYSQKLSGEFVQRGKLNIAKITKDKNFGEILSTFADYIIERNR